MKINAKLLVIAAVIAIIFSLGAVSATSENVTALSSEFTQVPHEQVVSVSEPTVQEVGATDLETSADNVESLSSSDNQVSIKDSDIKEESNIKKESKVSLLGSSYDNEILGAYSNEDVVGIPDNQEVLSDTIYVNGNYFQGLRDAITASKDGDIIDLRGKTISGANSKIEVENKNISIINGVLDGSNITNPNILDFHHCTLENISFTNFNFISNHDRMFKFDNVYLKNVRFENISGDRISGCFVTLIYTWKSTFDNVTFKNMTSTYSQQDNEFGVNVASYHSKFYNCTFQNTKTYQHSSAICVAGVSGNTVDIIDCKFINCTSGIGGAVYVHGTNTNENLHSNIINCDFINCTATEWGGAIGSSQDFLNVENCNFINNTAKQGAAIMIGGITHGLDGDNTQGHNDTIKNCYFYNNVGTEEGGSIHITGHNNTIEECNFDDNFAENGQGAAIYVEGHNSSVIGSNFTNHEAINGTIFIEGDNAKIAYSHFDNNEANNSGAAVYIHGKNATIDDSLFTNHKSDMGTVYIRGADASVINSKFKNNEASHGGAGVYIEGDHSLVDNSIFENNTVHRHGGAIHTIGDYAKITNSKFYDNDAIPNSLDPDYGLGGAIYINGNNNEISHSKFEGNTARNGSAIYTKGRELHIENDEFIENRAWSYLLITKATPSEAYWSEDLEFLLNITLVGGDNIINAIYNDASVGDIYFHNVTYELSDYSLFNSSMRTTTDSEIHPIEGVERSNGGRILYQDSREDNQRVTLDISYGGAEVFNKNDLITNLYGNVLVPIRKENLSDNQFHPGVYTAHATHPEDMLYTAIENSTTFRVLPHVDVSVTKTSNKDYYFVGENAIFTITVNSIGTNATNVTVRDILPDTFRFVSASATQGSYNSTTNEWYVGFMPHGASKTLTLTIQTTKLGTYDNVVNVTCTERDWNLSNNVDNKTIHVDLYYTKEANVTNTSAGEYIEYYLRVFNTGNEDYTEVIRVHDIMPAGIRYVDNYTLQGADLVYYLGYPDQQVWDIKNIRAGTHAKITIKALALIDGVWNNTFRVNDYPSVNSTVNVSSSADLHIIKDVIPTTVSIGDVVNWTITVINHGPSKAFNVYVDDLLPNGLEIAGHAIPSRNTRYDRDSGIWTIGTLDVEEYVTLVIPTKVTISAHNITNVAVVNSTTPDPDLTNNEDNDTIYFNPDVSITKIVSTQKTFYGDIISWIINVTNNGPNTATGIYVIDPITTNGLRYRNSTYTKGSGYNPVSGRWTIGILEEGESAVLTINTEVTIFDGFIFNNATVYANNDNDPSNNYAENFTQVRDEADVSIVKLVSNQTSHYGDEISWTIIVTNNGPNTARDVVVIDFLPNTLIQTREPYRSKGTISHMGSNGKWSVGSLANGENATLIVYTKVMVTNQTIINVVNVTSSTYDPDLSNNEAENGTYVPLECDVQIIKTVSNFNPNKGDSVIWTITVVNIGPNVAEDVVVTDILPAGLKYVSNSVPTAGTFNHVSGEWSIGTLEVNSRKTLTITTTVDGTGNITNEVNVTTITYDTNLKNNYANETINVGTGSDLEIIKIVSDKNPKFGDLITWTITVKNNGPSNAKDVYVIDKLPAGLIYVGDSSYGANYNPVSGRWTIGDLLNNASVSLTIATRVNITNATITNVAVVNSSTPDENETNNKANNTTVVDPKADLVVIKIVSNKTSKFGDTVIWTVIVTNKGPDTAVNVRVTDKLPAGLIFNGADGDYDSATGIWKVGNLAKGQSATLKITTIVNITNTTILNVANATSDTPGNNTPGNNTTDVKPLADLEIIKLVSNSTAKKGDVITWTIIVTNKGPDAAVNVIVKDKLPAGLTYNGHNADEGLYDPSKGIWSINKMKKGDSFKLIISSIVTISNGTIINIANVTSDTPDNNTDNNEANNTTNVKDVADLEIIKIVSNKNPHKGDTITWTITVTNNGPSDAKNVVVTDKLPAGLIFNGADGNYNPQTGVWVVGDLANGGSKSLVITTIVNITNKTIINIANVTSDTPDNNTDNNEANNTTDVGPEADLVVVKVVSNKNPHKGDTITWTITVTNMGPDTAVNVKVTDKLPAGLIFKGSDGDYDSKTGLWNVGNLVKGQSKSLVITTIVNITNTTIRNVANATSDTHDPDKSNNEGNNTTDVSPEADLEIVKLVSSKNALKGDVITWTIIVTNKGPDTALNVYVIDKLPNGLVIKSYTRTKGLFDSSDRKWFIQSLAKGESATLTIDTLVNVSSTTLLNSVNVTNDVYDPNETNNVANNTTDVGDELPADLEVIKVVSNKNPHKGDTITWTITVINHGPGNASDVTVTDYLPDGLRFISSNGNYNKNTGVWTIGDLAKGESKTLVITTVVEITNAEITNVAVVNSTTPDNNTDNNKDNDTAKVDPEADLKIVKTVSNPKPSKGDTVTWTIVVVNLGPDKAENVRVFENLPDGLKLLSAKGSKGQFDNGVWTIGEMANGEIATLVLTTKVLLSQGIIENIVVVNSTTYDPNKTNNVDSEITTPQEEPEDDPEDPSDDTPEESKHDDEGDDSAPNLGKSLSPHASKKMHATGNPIVMILLALLAAVGVSLRRRN